MIYIFTYVTPFFRRYEICPSVYHAMRLVSHYSGNFHYRSEVIPIELEPRTLDEFIEFISDGQTCDISRTDLFEFEFKYDISLQITDLYE